MQKLAVVYFPNINTDEIINFRRKYDPSWNIIPPHITIVSPISNISEDQLIDHVKTITKEEKSFPIHLNGLMKSFDNYLFLKVKDGNEKIVSLHDKIYSGLLTPYVPTDILFEPHVTLGYFGNEDNSLNEEIYNTAYSEAQGLHLDFICEFNEVSVIKGDGKSPAVTLETFTLLK